MTLEELEYANRERLPIILSKNESFHMVKEESIPHILEREGIGNPFWEKYEGNIIIYNMKMHYNDNWGLIIERSKGDNCGFISDCFDIYDEIILPERISELL